MVVTMLSYFKNGVGTWVRLLDALREINRSSKKFAVVQNSVLFQQVCIHLQMTISDIIFLFLLSFVVVFKKKTLHKGVEDLKFQVLFALCKGKYHSQIS